MSKRKTDKNKNVNLDALIQREDFTADDIETNPTTTIATISCNDLNKDTGFFLNSIRKPDFQRETVDWDTEKVVQFVKSFVDGEFIPAIILWKSKSGLNFVIDGSHRLSSLIAWINDDYGDKDFSLEAYDGQVPDEQRKIAVATRNKIESEIGSFKKFMTALKAKRPDIDIIEKARHLTSRALQLQWIDGDAERAERSFYNINQQAVPIDETELSLIQKRKRATGMAARAIAKAGKGHKYWDNFDSKVKEEIEKLSNEIHRLLFEPAIQRPIKTFDVPICDKSNNALLIICDLILLSNGEKSEIDAEVDVDGERTLACLKKVSKVVRTMNSNFAGSYGLHPILYCYSNKGNFRSASFYGLVEFVIRLKDKNNPQLLKSFIDNRRAFEDFIFHNDGIIQHLTNVHRHSLKSSKHIADYYVEILGLLDKKMPQPEIVSALTDTKKYGKLIYETTPSHTSASKQFSIDAKGEVYISASFASATRCAICGGLLHRHSISIDHIEPKRNGGVGNVENGQLTHPYCNTGVKN